MINLSETRMRTVNKSTIEKELKIINSKISLNASDIKETLDRNKLFLKGGTMTAFWNDVVIYIKLKE